MKKVILGGVLAGVVLFLWGGFSHAVLPLGEVGVKSLPTDKEAAVLEALSGAVSERAVYFYPGIDMKAATPEQQEAWSQKYAAGPGGIIVFDPHPGEHGASGMGGGTQLATEALTNILAALLAAWILSHLAPGLSFGKRALLAASLGLLITLDVDASYWNWYGFPTNYLFAQLADHVAGWSLAGLVLARFTRR
jgi:hypothetical protein